MSETDKLVVTKQYLEAKKRWERTLSSGENISILFPPVSDAQRRITQFMSDCSKKFIFVEIDPLNVTIEDPGDLENFLFEKLRDLSEFKDSKNLSSIIKILKESARKVVITSPLADFLFTPKGEHCFPLFQKIIFNYTHNIVCMFPYEINILSREKSSLVSTYRILFQNIDYYPLYKDFDTSLFIDYLIDKWNIKIGPKIKQKIMDNCSGHFWLIKEAVRQIRDNGTWDVSSESFQYRLKTIARSLGKEELAVITKVLGKNKKLNDDESSNYEYLKKIGLLNNKDMVNPILIKDKIIEMGEGSRKLEINGNEIFLNQIPVSKYFSRKEYRLIKLFIANEGKVINRDEIANAIWPMEVEDKYSEWAIDQLIRRLRNRLSELLISSSILKSVRGRGYRYG